MRSSLLILFPILVAAAEAAPPAAPAADQKVKISARLAPGAAALGFMAPILPAWEKAVGDGFTLCGKRIAARVDPKGKLELDQEGKGTFSQAPPTGALSVKVEREIDGKKRSATLPVQFTRAADGTWRWRSVGAVLVQIGDETLAAVDVDGDGQFNSPGVDGLMWAGQANAFPLPSPTERWCTAKAEITGFRMGAWGENPEAMGRLLATTVPAALPVLQDVNRERVKLGLTPRPESVSLSADEQKHCHFMALNDKLQHPEEPGKPGYTPEGNASGMRSILGMGTPAERLAAVMVATYYHRQDVVRPKTRAFGVGYEGRYGGIDGRTDMDDALAVVWPVLCPAREQRGVPLKFAPESPDPIGGDKDAGFPITAYFGTAKLKLVDGSVTPVGKNGKPGAPLDCYRFDPQQGGDTKFQRFQKVVCLIPKDPLADGTVYRVTMKIEVDGKEEQYDWNFQTEGAGKK